MPEHWPTFVEDMAELFQGSPDPNSITDRERYRIWEIGYHRQSLTVSGLGGRYPREIIKGIETETKDMEPKIHCTLPTASIALAQHLDNIKEYTRILLGDKDEV